MFKKYVTLILTSTFTFLLVMSPSYAADNKLQEWVEIENPLIFQLAEGAKGTGSRMTIHNNSEQDLIIEGFYSDVFSKTMMHDIKYKSGKRIMFEIKRITIPAHKKLALTPNTRHLMMFGPARKLTLNEFLTLTVKTNQGDFNIIAKVVDKRLK